MIYPREREVILRTSFVQVSVINTHAPHDGNIRIIILLFNEDWIRQPIRVQHLHNETSCEQPSDLVTNYFPSIFGEAPKDLFHGSGIRPDM